MSVKRSKRELPAAEPAEIVREYGPFEDVAQIHGVSYDGQAIWFAAGDKLHALDPSTGQRVRAFEVQSEAGTAYDGTHLYQLTNGCIAKIDPSTGRIVSTLQAPIQGDDAGLTWAEGTLWMSQGTTRTITQIDPTTGAVLKTLHSDRFVTGVTFVDGELWHATTGDEHSELRAIDPTTGVVRERLSLPEGVAVTGLESDGRDLFYCGGGKSGRLRALRKPKRHH